MTSAAARATRDVSGALPAPTPPAPAESKAVVIEREMRAAIQAGELEPGQRVPTGDIARKHGVSKMTVRRAVEKLCRDGLVVSVPDGKNSGLFVSQVPPSDG